MSFLGVSKRNGYKTKFFASLFSDHQNYFGLDDNLGPVAVSIKREKLDERENYLGKSETGLFQFRLILRTREVSIQHLSHLMKISDSGSRGIVLIVRLSELRKTILDPEYLYM